MARFLARFEQHHLRAKYVCPECSRVAYFRCYLNGPGERVRGRPREHFCICKARTDYRGFVS